MRLPNSSAEVLLLVGIPLVLSGILLLDGCSRSTEENRTIQRFEVVGNAPSCGQDQNQTTSESAQAECELPLSSESATSAETQMQPFSESLEKKEGERAMQMKLTSPAFQPGQPIPKKYTGEGEDLSPPLEWSNAPEEAQEFALICDDPDAPVAEPWVHWVIYKIPRDVTKLPEGVAKTAKLFNPPGALQGKNSWPSGQTIGYRGPMPPPGHGRHRYYFRIYALDKPLNLAPGATKKELLEAMKGHILAQAELMGTYERR
ncbi:MAG: YbhB/YbcL family Raf kinase inhibitor-like protein [Thermogutta sp.]